ncbi:MAG: hypothetical protein ACT4PK_04095 [Gammaproteobacteria bacterium]
MEATAVQPGRRFGRPEALGALALPAILLLCFLVYRPGLTGAFQFDDHSNLNTLEALRDNPTADQLAQFFLKGISSPLGRPISLLSFAAQAADWPDHPGHFIRANVLLHLLNGALLFWWLRRLARLGAIAGESPLALPLAATALWLLAPIQATAVVYVVQRMTELATTFVFLGMGLYLLGRERLGQGRETVGLVWMSLGLAVGAGLGTLAKESAAQMPLMVLALEATLLASQPRPRAWRAWAVPFLALPALVLLGYLAWVGVTGHGYVGRDFTAPERLLTEPRVLFMYVYKTLAPWPTGIRLWYDDLAISTGLLSPWNTGLALLGLAGSAFAGWRLRRRAPLFAFAVLWFLASHVLESSALPLELAFEHRNYFASAGLWLAVAAGFAALLRQASSTQARNVFAGLAVLYLGAQAMVTSQIAALWGRPLELAAVMAARLPDSERATQAYISGLMRAQLPFDSALRANAAARRFPDNPSFPLMALMLSCQVREIPHPTADDLLHRLRTNRNANTVVDYLDSLVSLLEAGHCPVGLPVKLTELTAAALANPAVRVQRQNQLLLHSRALKVESRRAEARATFRQAVDVRPQMILLIQGVIDAVEAGDLELARHYLARLRDDPRIRPRDRWSHRNDIPLLEALVRSRETPAASQ